MIKYKEDGNDEFVRISTDEEGKEIKTASFGPNNKPRTMGAGFYVEMLEWSKIKGNEIEPQFTAEEQSAKDQEEVDAAIEATKSTCILYLNDSEIHVSNDPPYPADLQEWTDSRSAWRTILKSGKAQAVPDKPYGG